MSKYDISIMSDDQINYNSLSEITLRDLVLGDDLFVATSALATLAMRKSNLAGELAGKILENMLGDDYLQSAAINILFDSDRSRSLELLIERMATCKPYIFNTILELMIQNTDVFKSTATYPIVRLALERIDQVTKPSKWPSREVLDSFLEIFGQDG